MEQHEIIYRMSLGDGSQVEHRTSAGSREGDAREIGAPPAWTRLDYCRCPNCPLSSAETPHCPAALQLAPLLGKVAGLRSFDEVRATVTMPGRVIAARTSAQRALSSLVGLILAVSGCPHTVWLRPMAYFHLPFASEEETLYRAASMYMLAQYFRHRGGEPVDLELAGLIEIYRRLQVINRSLAERLRGATDEDAAANAVILLDVLAKAVPWSVDEALELLQPLFSDYRGAGDGGPPPPV